MACLRCFKKNVSALSSPSFSSSARSLSLPPRLPLRPVARVSSPSSAQCSLLSAHCFLSTLSQCLECSVLSAQCFVCALHSCTLHSCALHRLVCTGLHSCALHWYCAGLHPCSFAALLWPALVHAALVCARCTHICAALVHAASCALH